MAPLVELEVALARLGLDPTDPKADDVARLLDSISTEIRRRTKRGFEGGEGATYDEVYRLPDDPGPPFGWYRPHLSSWFSGGMWTGPGTPVTLRHAPVASITSIAQQRFDGTEYGTVASTLYRIDDAARGLISVRAWAPYLHVVYRVTGEVPNDVSQAALSWLESEWSDEPRDRAQTSYTIGAESESVDVARLGQPPAIAARVLAGYFHSTAGGPV